MTEAIQTWQIHERINEYLLNSVEEQYLADISASKGRTVGEQFAHINNVRLMWLGVASPRFLTNTVKIEKTETGKKEVLLSALQASSTAIEALLEQGFRTGKIKNFKPHPMAFLGYLISHESHHRGQIMLALKQSGHPVDKKTQFGIWEWGVR